MRPVAFKLKTCRSRAVLVGVLALVLFARNAHATTALRMTFDELVARASLIFRGEVIDLRSEWQYDETGRHIVTIVTFRVRSVLKGAQSDTIRLEFLGGTIGEETLRVADSPQFSIGDRDILFVHDRDRPVSPIVGSAPGR